MTLKTRLAAAALLAAALVATAAQGETIEVQNAWVRATVKGQLATGAFMTLTARDGARLVSASSPAAGVTEVHEMKMEAGVMKMSAVKGGLDLPAGKPVALESGGYHLMLMDLKAPLIKGSSVPLNLVFKNARGEQRKLALQVPVAAKAPGHAAGMDHAAHGKPALPDHPHGGAVHKSAP